MHRFACLLSLCAVLSAQPVCAETSDFRGQRQAGETLARLGAEQQDPDILFAALDLLIRGGASVEAGDPWGADLLYLDLLNRAGDDPARRAALERLMAPRRGVKGPNRVPFNLAPGSSETVRVGLLPGETAMVEVRLQRNSGMADVGMTVTDVDGTVIAREETGPGSGRAGQGLYLEWTPETCQIVDVVIRNIGTAPAQGVFLAPPPQDRTC